MGSLLPPQTHPLLLIRGFLELLEFLQQSVHTHSSVVNSLKVGVGLIIHLFGEVLLRAYETTSISTTNSSWEQWDIWTLYMDIMSACATKRTRKYNSLPIQPLHTPVTIVFEHTVLCWSLLPCLPSCCCCCCCCCGGCWRWRLCGGSFTIPMPPLAPVPR